MTASTGETKPDSHSHSDDHGRAHHEGREHSHGHGTGSSRWSAIKQGSANCSEHIPTIPQSRSTVPWKAALAARGH